MSCRSHRTRTSLGRLVGLALVLTASVAVAQTPPDATPDGQTSKAKTAAAGKGAKAPPGAAASKAQPRGGKQGQGQPIEIVADNLVVQQDNRVAIFTGHVDAKQGGLRVRADQLKVFYNDPKAQAAAGGQQVQLIEAQGNVLVTQHGDTAQGDHGTYRVAEAMVTLDGNVVLTQGQNVVRGARLESNLDTGVSRVFASESGGQPGVEPKQRVRALFLPGQPAGAAGGTPQTGGSKAPAKPQSRLEGAPSVSTAQSRGQGAGDGQGR